MGDLSKDIQSKFKNNKVKALLNIKYTANWLSNQEIEFFKAYSISPQQYNVLRILRGAGEKVSVQEVKEKMVVKSPNTTRLTDKLIDKKFIKRSRCIEDRRVVYIEITTQGLELLLAIDNKISKLSLLGKLTEEEAKILSDLLDKLR